MRGVAVSLAALALSAATPALACEGEIVHFSYLDEPIKVEADGSFRVPDRLQSRRNNYSDYYNLQMVSGAAAIDIGEGRVGQKISYEGMCSTVQYLHFIDCTTGEAIGIEGLYVDTMIGGLNLLSIAQLQQPRGPIGLTAKTTVAELQAIAQANEYEYTLDLMARVNRMIRSQRYDPFIGCKIFYPDSVGARS